MHNVKCTIFETVQPLKIHSPISLVEALSQRSTYNVRVNFERNNMRRFLFLSISASFIFGASAVCQQQDWDKVQIKVQKAAGAVYMLEGRGGNIGASVGEDGIVIVDDEFLPLADKIEAAPKGITDKPIKFILNTHWHGDHTGGNEHFGAE